MSIARAFTTRRSKKVPEISAPLPHRSLTTKQALAGGSIRNKISAPVVLLSTTNMLSYNAPDLYPGPPSSPPSLTHSSSSSARSVSSEEIASPTSNVTTPATSPVVVQGRSPSPNHLSCYFEKRPSTPEQDSSAPVIPQRSPSHTKRNHEILHRKRSVSRISARTHSVKTSVSSFARDSIQMFSSTPELIDDAEDTDAASRTPSPRQPSERTFEKPSRSAHPFGAELAQVTELAEEFGVTIVDPEEEELVSRGLYKFAAADYMAEIEMDFVKAFGAMERRGRGEAWI